MTEDPNRPQTFERKIWGTRLLISVGMVWLVYAGLNAFGIGIRVTVHPVQGSMSAVKAGDPAKCIFRVTNYSLQSIRVDTQPTCGCTIVDKDRFTVLPFTSTTFAASVDTTGSGRGKYQKVVHVNMATSVKEWNEEVFIPFQVM